jgi:hypothetical protein
VQSEELHVQPRQTTATTLGLGPRLPRALQIAGVLPLHLGAKVVTAQLDAAGGVDRRVGCGCEVVWGPAHVPMSAGSDQRSPLHAARKPGRHEQCQADVQPRCKPGIVGFGREPGTGWPRNRQPDLVRAVLAGVVEPHSVHCDELVLEQQEAAVVHDVVHQLRAQLDRLLHVVDEREQTLALDAHGMLAGS